MYEQAEYRPVSKALRNQWLKNGRRIGYSFLVITVSDDIPLEFKPRYVTDKADLFTVIGTYHTQENCNVVEIYNLGCPLALQVEKELFTDLNLEIYKYPSSPPYYEKWQAEIEQYPALDVGSWLPSQFDLDYWFNTGRKKGRDYLIIVCQDSVYAEYYPLFADKSNLSDTISIYQRRVHCSVIEVYNLHYEFREQYMNRFCSVLPKPETFYGFREETIRELFDDEGLDEIRRRIWDYLLNLGPECGAITLRSYETAYELMSRCQTPRMRQSEMMPVLMLKAMELFPLENGENYPAQPFYVIYDNIGTIPWASKASGSNMRNRDPLVREFSMACMNFTSNATDYDILLDIIPDFIEENSDLRALLCLFWRYSGAKKQKRQLVRSWMETPELKAELKNQLRNSLRPDYEPMVFRPYVIWHSIYKSIFYRGEVNLELFRHLDPDPVLSLPHELARTRSKAEAGDLNSQLILGAANMYGIGVELDREEGLKWAYKAAEQNHPTAYLLLGDAFIRNTPENDDQKAMGYYQKAADMGYAQAWWIMADNYRTGETVPRDYVKSLAYFLAAGAYLEDVDDILQDGIDGMKSLLNQDELDQAFALAIELSHQFVQQEYEPLKYMYYFNPKGQNCYWLKKWS